MTTYRAASGKTIDFATLSRQGARDYNEDACGYWTSDVGACFVVSDGAGGHGGGDVASEAAVKTFLIGFSELPSIEKPHIDSLLLQADAAIRYGQQLSGGLKKMSATIAGLFFDENADFAQWIHLGDTRIYFIRRRECRQLTKDHSLVQRFIDSGMLQAAAAHEAVARNVLYAALGTGDEMLCESLDVPFRVQDGDVFLICSDGFWEDVEVGALVNTLTASASAEEWLIRIEEEILNKQSLAQDNYSAVAVWVGAPNEITLPWDPALYDKSHMDNRNHDN